QLAEVLDVVVIGAQEAAIAEAGQARDLVDAARDRARADRPTAPRAPFHLLQVETRRQRMTALADERAATGVAPDAVDRRVRAAVRFAAQHPEDLRVGLLEDLALFLDRGRIDPVLGVAEDHAPAYRPSGEPIGARDRLFQQRLLARAVAGDRAVRRSERAGERLLDHDVL